MTWKSPRNTIEWLTLGERIGDMGFFVMVISGLVGVFLVGFGAVRVKQRAANKATLLLGAAGLLLILFSVWLGWPK